MFFVLESESGTRVTLPILSTEKQPVIGAVYSYKTKYRDRKVSTQSDASGRIALLVKNRDVIDGKILPSSIYSGVDVYISNGSNKLNLMRVIRQWGTTFAG